MNVKNNVKKIVALGAAGALVATTFVGALAYDLSSYPAPFVEDGMLNGAIVIGEMAKPIDVIGAMDIAASLQADAVTAVTTTGTAAATTTIVGGMLLEDDNNQDLNFKETVSSTKLDDQEFPSLMADSKIDDDDGTSIDFTQELTIANIDFKFDNPNNDVYDKPILYLDTTPTSDFTMTYKVDFDSDVDFEAFDDSETFAMFGKSFTVKNVAESDKLVLFAGDYAETINMGEPLIVEIDGTTYNIEVQEANAAAETVWLVVNGVGNSVSQGDTKNYDGLDIYIQRLFVADTAGETALVTIFVGSSEFDLGYAQTGTSTTDLKINDDRVDGVKVLVKATADLDDVDYIEFTVTPKNIDNDETGKEFDWLALGETFVDPVFGFKVEFTEAVPDLTADNKGLIDFKASSNSVDLKFTNMAGDDYSWEAFQYASSAIAVGDDFVVPDNSTAVAEDSIFFATEDYSSNKPITHILQVESVYVEGSINKTDFIDVSTGKEYTVKESLTVDQQIGDTDMMVMRGGMDPTADTVVLGIVDATGVEDGLTIYNEQNVKINIPTNTTYTEDVFHIWNITEDASSVNYDESGHSSIVQVKFKYHSTDSEFKLATNLTVVADEANAIEYAITDYGTFLELDEDDKWAKLYTPNEEMDLNVYLAPPNAVRVVSAAASTGAYIVNPAGLGVGIMDADAPSLGSKPMIVVGGPIVNTVAAELMGNPTTAEIYETFEAGKAMIKFYSAHDAILVAGFEALETQAACNVLVNYEMYDLAGEEMEVLATSLDDIQVNAVN